MRNFLFLLLYLPASSQFSSRLFTTVSKPGIVGYARQNLIFESKYNQAEVNTTGYPGSVGMPTLGWNTGTGEYLEGFDNSSQSCCNYSIRKETSVVWKSAASVKFTLLSTDPVVSSSNRVEKVMAPSFTQPTTVDRWYGFSIRLDNWGTLTCCQSIFQWHDNTVSPDLCPPLSLQVDGSGNIIMVTSIACNTIPYTIGTLSGGSGWNNRWVDVVFHVNWTTASTGTIDLWVDGVLKQSLGPQKTQSNGGHNLKLGINSFSGAANRSMYFANFRVGNSSATYADVAP